jgi:hypothetical protein
LLCQLADGNQAERLGATRLSNKVAEQAPGPRIVSDQQFTMLLIITPQN